MSEPVPNSAPAPTPGAGPTPRPVRARARLATATPPQGAGTTPPADPAKPTATAGKSVAKGGIFEKVAYVVPVVMMVAGYFLSHFFLKADTRIVEIEDDHEHAASGSTIDDLLISEKYVDALKQIEIHLKSAPSGDRPPLQFRAALCLEGQNEFQKAAEYYGELAGSGYEPRRVAARFGLARSWAGQKRMDDARTILSQLTLTLPASADPVLREELAHVKADIELRNLPKTPGPSPVSNSGLASSDRRIDLARYLDWAGAIAKHHGDAHGSADSHGSSHDSHSTAPKQGASSTTDHSKDHGSESHAPPKSKSGAKEKDNHTSDKPADHHDDAHPPAKKPATPKEDHHEDAHPSAKKPATPKEDHHDDAHPPAKKPATPKEEHAPKEKHDPHAVSFILDDHGHTEPTPAKTAPAPPPTTGGPVIFFELSRNFIESKLTAKLPDAPVVDQLTTLLQEAGLELRWKDKGKLGGRRIRIDIERLPFDECLDALTEPYGMTWVLQENAIRIEPAQVGLDGARALAKRVLEKAYAAGNDHPRHLGYLIEIGNLEHATGHPKEARQAYQRLLAEAPTRSETALAAYNLAMLQLQKGERGLARDHLMDVADRDPTGKWSSLAYFWIGRSLLDSDEPDKALKFFAQARSASADSPGGIASILGICLAEYRGSRYREGIDLLREHRKKFQAPPYRLTAAFLDALGSYKLAEEPTRTGEYETLMAATLKRNFESMCLGPMETFLVGEVCREFGIGPRMIDLYEKTLVNFRGPLAIRMTLDLADVFLADGLDEKAKPCFQAVAVADRGASGSVARTHLIRMAIAAKQYDDAFRLAREMASHSATEALSWTGKTYEAKKDFRRAAECFAGRWPD